MTIEHILEQLIELYSTVGKLDTLTYEDYYRVQSRLAKWFKSIAEEVGYTERKIGSPNSSRKYIKNG